MAIKNTKKEILLDKISIHGYFDYLAKGDSKKSLSLSLAKAHAQINNLLDMKFQVDYSQSRQLFHRNG